MDRYISIKTSRVLNVIILGMLLILSRVWYLAVMHKEEHELLAKRPQRRTLIEHAERGTIRDRFNIPLAVNKLQYNAAICYAPIRQIPAVSWKIDASGKKERLTPRLAYIKEFSTKLAKELDLDAQLIEDTVHGKAALFPHTPFVIKEGLSEEQYYRLKMLEGTLAGLQTQRTTKRIYPQGKVASDIVGYIGAISQKEFSHIADETKQLQTYISQRESGEMPYLPKGFDSPLDVRERLKQLQEKAYTLNDLVGKSGIEAAFDEELRGFYGKKIMEVDIKGNFLRELPGSRKATAGKRVLLSLSMQLQEYAEALLARHEKVRETRCLDRKRELNTPWMKGGAIVVLIPETNETLALASYPRFDPNDFVPTANPKIKMEKSAALARWLESEAYLGEIWDGTRPIARESYDAGKKQFYEELVDLTWDEFLKRILSLRSPIWGVLQKINNLKGAHALLTRIEALPKLEGEIDPLLFSIPHIEDRLLALDLCRLLIKKELFSEALLEEVGLFSLATYRAHSRALHGAQKELRNQLHELYRESDFRQWRERHFKAYLQERRKEEKAKRRAAKPYTDYLEAIEKSHFQEWWTGYKHLFLETYICAKPPLNYETPSEISPYLAYLVQLRHEKKSRALDSLKEVLDAMPPHLCTEYVKSMRSFDELDRPLLGKYRNVKKGENGSLEKHLAAAFYPVRGFGHTRSQAYRQTSPVGSVFKLVTAYEGLRQRYLEMDEEYPSSEKLNPLTLIDDLKPPIKGKFHEQILGYTLGGEPITRMYKGGRMPQSSHANIGKVNLLSAIEQSSNIYFALLASEHMANPNLLSEAAREFGFGEKTGIELPGETSGIVPVDLMQNLAGLYSFAIGQHAFSVTPLQTALMTSVFANQGRLLKPKIVKMIAGKSPSQEDDSLYSERDFPFKNDLGLVGISFPLFTQANARTQEALLLPSRTEIKRSLFLPEVLRSELLVGMRRVVAGARGSARPALVRALRLEGASAIQDYQDISPYLIGKTGTAEVSYRSHIDMEAKTELKKHVWFAGVTYPKPIQNDNNPSTWGEPELVVVVFLRYADAGREAATLASQVIKKWRQIRAEHEQDAPN
jgi:cell division protein FtsI/penicillin-binding protein 2